DEDTLEKILVCIRDITKIKALTAESEEQKKKIEMIGQILKVLPDDFGEFIGSANKYIKENTELIKEKGELPPIGVMEQLFRNMHTIKGNARTHDFVYVSNAAHEAEQEYDQLRKGLKKEWDPSLLILHLEDLEDALKIYEDVHDNVLGRGKGDGGNASEGSGKIKENISEILNLVNAANPDNPNKIRQDLQVVSQRLFSLSAVNLEQILSNLIKSLESLAEDLEKEVPEVVIDDGGILFNYEKSSAMKDIFTHIVRNSIDHGIETPEERKKKGKNSKGKITITGSEEENFNKIIVKDDGQGLNIQKIKEKAIESGQLKESGNEDPQTLANMVFLSGVSTAKEVTDVSGRGVGMDAVKSFLKGMGGDIEIEFLNDDRNNGDMISFCWIIKIPRDSTTQGVLSSKPA
ncbi:MAG: ATP-binding protein, partial [Bdellovibrionota bacterium]|nr:ATP-binding protein [Bdellovibrionota bacterium]